MRIRKSEFAGDILLSFVALVACVVVVYPLIYTASVSLSASAEIAANDVTFFPRSFTTVAYDRVLHMRKVTLGFKNSVVYTTVGTCINILLTTSLGYAISRRELVGRKFFTILLTIPLFISGGIVPTFMVIKMLGMIDTMWAVILPFAVLSYYLIIVKSFYESIPDSIIESAKIDGANDISIFWRIIIPMSTTIIATIGLFYAIYNWNNFRNPLFYLNDNDKFPLVIVLKNMLVSTEMISYTQKSGEEIVSLEAMQSATIVISVIPILIVYPFVQKYFKQGVTMGSVKG